MQKRCFNQSINRLCLECKFSKCNSGLEELEIVIIFFFIKRPVIKLGNMKSAFLEYDRRLCC